MTLAPDSDRSQEPDTQKGIPPLHIGIAAVALLLIIGAGFVAFQQPAVKATATPTASVQATVSGSANAIPTVPSANVPKDAELTGKARCQSGNKTPVLLFTDPYCPACAQADPQVNAFYDKYAPKTDVKYRMVVTHSASLAKTYGNDAVYRTHDYWVCAQEQGRIQAFKDCFYQTVQVRDGDFVPMNATSLDACAATSGLNKAQLETCKPGARANVQAAIAEAADFGGGSYYTPMAVVGCQYRVKSVLAEQTYCAVSGAC